MKKKTRRNVSLDPDVERLLSRIQEGDGTVSGYLSALVRTADQEWRHALAELRTIGWLSDELFAACEVLNGWPPGGDLRLKTPGALAMELLGGQQLTDQWSVDPGRWTDHITRLRASEREAQALEVIAREFWRMNPIIVRAIENS